MRTGDRNSSFFHASILVRRRRNQILTLLEDGVWFHERKQIEELLIKNFQELFSSENHDVCVDLGELVTRCISQKENSELIRIPSTEEVKQSIWDLHPLKSPGPYGFLGIFYRTYWSIVRSQTIEFVQECFCQQQMPKTLNTTFLVLIPKVKKLIYFNHYRPISLCNFTYKIVFHILSNRLSPLLQKFVSPNQGAFTKGRWIAKHTVLA